VKKRFFAALSGLLLSTLWVSPAFAMSAPVFLEGPDAGSVADGTVAIKVEAKPDSILGIGLEQVSIKVTASGPGGTVTIGDRPGSVFEGSWNVDALPLNGVYELKATAYSSNSATKTSTVSGIKVNNPPAPPTGVRAVLKEGVPVVSWNENPEADITGYKLLRSSGGGSFTQVYGGTATSAGDTNAPHSKPLTYKVVAVRKSPVSAGVESTSAATSALTVPAPPEPAAPGPGEPAPGGPPPDPSKPVIPGTNIVTGKESPKPGIVPNKGFGKAIAPIVKSAPAGTAFDETLPYSGVPPEQFEAASGGDPSVFDAGAADSTGPTVTNPLKFIVGGIVLMIASFFMWRASRKLLEGTRPQDQIAPTRVNFPTFRVNRG
jgi:hypothetical protein